MTSQVAPELLKPGWEHFEAPVPVTLSGTEWTLVTAVLGMVGRDPEYHPAEMREALVKLERHIDLQVADVLSDEALGEVQRGDIRG